MLGGKGHAHQSSNLWQTSCFSSVCKSNRWHMVRISSLKLVQEEKTNFTFWNVTSRWKQINLFFVVYLNPMSVLMSCFTAFYDKFLDLPPPSEQNLSKSTTASSIIPGMLWTCFQCLAPSRCSLPHSLQQTLWKPYLLSLSGIVSK